MVKIFSRALFVSSFLVAATPAFAADMCATGKTIEQGVLTVATGNPAYYPWVIDDAPASGEGFEAAVAYAVAEKMGFSADAVKWTRTSFDEAIQPGVKDFDVNLQQFSITEDRKKVVDFSLPYYSAAMAVLVRTPTVENGLTADLAALKDIKWGAVATTTALPAIMGLVQPSSDPLLYDDTANVAEAMKANQIDAGIFDLPTALYLSAVVLDDGVVLGQFASDGSQGLDQFGMIMTKDNPLKACVDEAIVSLSEDGTLGEIEAQWMQQATGVPVIK